jgi:hypothetical protein
MFVPLPSSYSKLRISACLASAGVVLSPFASLRMKGLGDHPWFPSTLRRGLRGGVKSAPGEAMRKADKPKETAQSLLK